MVTVAPFMLLSLELTRTPESTATAGPPTRNRLVAPEAITTGCDVSTFIALLVTLLRPVAVACRV